MTQKTHAAGWPAQAASGFWMVGGHRWKPRGVACSVDLLGTSSNSRSFILRSTSPGV